MATFTLTSSASISAAKDLLVVSALPVPVHPELAFPSPIRVTQVEVSTDANVDEQWAIGLYRATAAGTGTVITAAGHDDSGSFDDHGTAIGNLSVAATKDSQPIHRAGFPASFGYCWDVDDEEEGVVLRPGHHLAVSLLTSPASAAVITVVVTLALPD